MQALLKLLTILGELIQALLNQRAKVKRDESIAAIRNDPAGEFVNEFGGVPVKSTEPPAMPGSKADTKVGSKE
jgi:hypothetical protein